MAESLDIPAEKLRVALFSGNYCATKDGAAVALNRLVAFLESQDVEVLVFSPTVDEPQIEPSGTLIPVASLPAPGRGEYRIAFGLPRGPRKRLDAFKPHLIHLSAPDLLGLAARRYALKHEIPLVASFHTRFDTYFRYYGAKVLERKATDYLRYFYRPCIHVYAPSQSMVDELAEAGIGRDLRLWTRGVDASLFQPKARDMAWRRRLGFADDDVVVAFVSRLVKEKGLETYAQVLDGLAARGVPAKALVIGDGPERAWMADRMPNAVFTGYLAGKELARGYASGDVFLFPSVTETFGIVTLEAMASGLAPICADASGSRSLIQDGENGYLVTHGDVQGFTDKAQALVEDASLRSSIAQAATTAAAVYDWDRAMHAILGHYRQALAGEAPA